MNDFGYCPITLHRVRAKLIGRSTNFSEGKVIWGGVHIQMNKFWFVFSIFGRKLSVLKLRGSKEATVLQRIVLNVFLRIV